MAYFSNGTSGEIFQELWCSRCIHDVNQDCPVWLLHLIYNYKDEFKVILDTLITDDIHDPRCKLFHQATKEESIPKRSAEQEKLLLEEWNKMVKENGV